jgi:hypothetical protein
LIIEPGSALVAPSKRYVMGPTSEPVGSGSLVTVAPPSNAKRMWPSLLPPLIRVNTSSTG